MAGQWEPRPAGRSDAMDAEHDAIAVAPSSDVEVASIDGNRGDRRLRVHGRPRQKSSAHVATCFQPTVPLRLTASLTSNANDPILPWPRAKSIGHSGSRLSL